KMFSTSATNFDAPANSNVDPVSLGLPGALPVVNAKGVEWAIKIGLALNCSIAESSRFARKNYFYPDQPKNYQISQYDEPIAYDGYLDVVLEDGTEWRVEIERAHMEEDTGKLTHLGGTSGRIHGATASLVDCNRAGIPLIEIVTKPIEGAGERAPEIARAYVTALRDLVAALGVSDARMDQGSMRVDSNLSLRPVGTTEFGTRTETKNINSLRSVEQAVRFEMMRQAQVLDDGGVIDQETRHYQETDGSTRSLRPVVHTEFGNRREIKNISFLRSVGRAFRFEMMRQAQVLEVGGVIDQETRHYQETDGSTSKGRPKETADDYRYFNDPD